MGNLKIRICDLANKEHEDSLRQYAHTFHRSDYICLATEFFELPIDYAMGILAHEVGHLLSGSNSSELEADHAVMRKLGVTIHYMDSKFGDSLQTLDRDDTEFMLNNIFFGLVKESLLRVRGG